ncbi:hypothetical protein BDD12DRAFT_802436 [Trichophaea hybrida]|nr:hypothetical protein BDD12DRAFT_802436 [Trichophaea hybrida]
MSGHGHKYRSFMPRTRLLLKPRTECVKPVTSPKLILQTGTNCLIPTSVLGFSKTRGNINAAGRRVLSCNGRTEGLGVSKRIGTADYRHYISAFCTVVGLTIVKAANWPFLSG